MIFQTAAEHILRVRSMFLPETINTKVLVVVRS